MQQAPQQDTSAILAALANMAKQNPAAQPATAMPGQASLNNMLGAQNGSQGLPPNVNGLPTANGQPVNPLGALFAGMSNGGQQTQSSAPPHPFAAFLPQPQAPPVLPQNAPVAAPKCRTILSTAPAGVVKIKKEEKVHNVVTKDWTPPDCHYVRAVRNL